VDFNRAGTPLVEIVTEPDVRSPEEARRFLQLLRQTIVELGISDAEMEKGSLRCDANVSVREAGEEGYRTKTELKNMNSFKFVADGIAAELARQIEIYEGGGAVDQETLHFDPSTGGLTSLRSKEEAHDYRYFPEPDLVPVEPSAELIGHAGENLPELPGLRIRRFEAAYGLAFYDADVLNGSAPLAALFERTVVAGADAKAAANVLQNQFAGAEVDPAAVDATELAKLVEGRDSIPRATFADALAASGAEGFSADRYLADTSISDEAELDPVIDKILAANAGQVEQYRGGKEGLLGFFVGQVMKETGGKANPKVVSERVKEKLGA
jgi:aspartyl-tRNA(Asn)/glutamyl-tRNA(Gln) amidotransferase subunit B